MRWLWAMLAIVSCARHNVVPREASVRITASDTIAAMEQVTRTAEAMGGHVAEARVWREGGRVRATLIVRVPAKQLTSVMADVRRAATRVESESISSRDMNRRWIPSS